MTGTYSSILFDLDGTITDSAPGITSTLAWTFEKLGLPAPERDELIHWVGPPLLDSFRDRAGFSAEQAQRALELYRAKYLDDGAYDSTVFPGIPALLRRIGAAPISLSLATSKPELPATLMLEHFSLASYFDVITGASADESRAAKEDVIAEALTRLTAIGADVSRVVMVGDREHDVAGAAAHGIPTIFVEWGYGSVAEQAGAFAVATTARELEELLGLAPTALAS